MGIGDADGAAMGLDDGLADRQADPARTAAMSTAEGLEDPHAVGCQHRVAPVLHPDLHQWPSGTRTETDGGPGRAVASRVLQEVGHDEVQLRVVRMDEREIGSKVEFDPVVSEEATEAAHGAGQQARLPWPRDSWR